MQNALPNARPGVGFRYISAKIKVVSGASEQVNFLVRPNLLNGSSKQGFWFRPGPVSPSPVPGLCAAAAVRWPHLGSFLTCLLQIESPLILFIGLSSFLNNCSYGLSCFYQVLRLQLC